MLPAVVQIPRPHHGAVGIAEKFKRKTETLFVFRGALRRVHGQGIDIRPGTPERVMAIAISGQLLFAEWTPVPTIEHEDHRPRPDEIVESAWLPCRIQDSEVGRYLSKAWSMRWVRWLGRHRSARGKTWRTSLRRRPRRRDDVQASSWPSLDTCGAPVRANIERCCRPRPAERGGSNMTQSILCCTGSRSRPAAFV